MTFSLIGRCPRTGQLGAALANSSIASGARIAFCESGVGALLCQHCTDPRLGPRGLGLLRSGCTAQETLEALVASTSHAGWRQIAVLDAAGQSAAHSGGRVRPAVTAALAEDACAIGNVLAHTGVPAAMLRAFQEETAVDLAERLMRALEHGVQAGGDVQPVRSAHLLVVERHSFPLVDLRIDWDDAPVGALRALWTRYAPLSGDFMVHATDPDKASLR